MRDKLFRSITLAVVAAFSLGVAAHADNTMAQTSVSNDTSLVALGCNPPKKSCHRVVHKACKRVSTRPAQIIKETKVVKTETIEKPVVIQAPQQTQQIMSQPAVVENGPVIIDRYQKVHRSLIHLGLFPFSLFGQ